MRIYYVYMIRPIIRLLKLLLPASLLNKVRPIGHGLLAKIANFRYGHPSEKLIVIGVTGTAGKSTTINILAHILNTTGHKTGFVTTANYSYGSEVLTNEHGLSMPNEFLLQKQLAIMAARKCQYAIIECTSEGLAQNRHLGINFDVALLTNLSPAHIEAHGSFENYRATKGKLFATLGTSHKKPIFTKKIIGVNIDDANAEFFLQFPADTAFGISTRQASPVFRTYAIREAKADPLLSFTLDGTPIKTNLFGLFNSYNTGLALAAALELAIEPQKAREAIAIFPGVAGRMEKIPTTTGIDIFVDYAPEPVGMEDALNAVSTLPHKRIIHVFGSTGGHRDSAKRFEFGKITASKSDVVIITNDDVYDSNPKEIAENIREGINQIPESHRKAKQIEMVLDRKEALRRAITLAEKGDIILATGKGSEQFLVLPENKRIKWDERKVIEELLAKIYA